MAPDKSRIWSSPFHTSKGAFAGCLLAFHISKHKIVFPLTDLRGGKSGLPHILLVKVITYLLSFSSLGLIPSRMD